MFKRSLDLVFTNVTCLIGIYQPKEDLSNGPTQYTYVVCLSLITTERPSWTETLQLVQLVAMKRRGRGSDPLSGLPSAAAASRRQNLPAIDPKARPSQSFSRSERPFYADDCRTTPILLLRCSKKTLLRRKEINSKAQYIIQSYVMRNCYVKRPDSGLATAAGPCGAPLNQREDL